MFLAARRVLFWMGVLIAGAALVVAYAFGGSEAMALLYGGAVAWANVGLLFWRWRRGVSEHHCDPSRHLKSFHRSMLERFFVVGVLLAPGFVLSAHPAILLAGFVVGQLAWLLASLTLRERT